MQTIYMVDIWLIMPSLKKTKLLDDLFSVTLQENRHCVLKHNPFQMMC